jgi:hypothetical protein
MAIGLRELLDSGPHRISGTLALGDRKPIPICDVKQA